MENATKYQRFSIISLRLVLGWYMFYAGVTKVLNPNWSAVDYLQGSKTFGGFYAWLASPALLPIVNFLNEWGLTLLGASLILGVLVRLSSVLGALLMLLYYFPILQFPYPDAHSFIVDNHIIFVAALLLLGALRAGRVWGLENWCSRLPICSQYPRLRNWLG